MKNDSVRYFAAANSSDGFCSLFDKIFSPDVLDRIYIIKGGPGTGKSTLMKKIGEEAEERGLSPEYVLCSSDPESLDGVIIPELSTAFADGTSPHVIEPKYPVAVERIIDLYNCMNSKKLSLSRFAVMEQVSLAERETASGYGFLRAAGELLREAGRISASLFDGEKAEAAARRLLGGVVSSEGGGAVFGEAMCHRGRKWVDPYFFKAEKRFAVTGKYGADALFLHSLCRSAEKLGLGFTRVLSAITPENVGGVYFDGPKIYFSIFDEKNGDLYDKRINAMRFVDEGKLSLCRGKLRFFLRCAESVSAGAAECFARAREHHAELERIYGAAADFSRVDAVRDEICRGLFANL